MSLEKYKTYLQNRYVTFNKAKKIFDDNNGRVILELGTTRSFVDGSHIGCMKDDPQYWYPNNPELWDWGAGAFTIVFSEMYKNTNVKITTVDIMSSHIQRCKLMTQHNNNITYVVDSSLSHLASLPSESVDFLYQDTCDCDDNGARHHLEEAKILINRNIIKKNGILLIDDHKTTMPELVSKTKYSLDFYLQNGFIVIEEDQQLLLQKQ